MDSHSWYHRDIYNSSNIYIYFSIIFKFCLLVCFFLSRPKLIGSGYAAENLKKECCMNILTSFVCSDCSIRVIVERFSDRACAGFWFIVAQSKKKYLAIVA